MEENNSNETTDQFLEALVTGGAQNSADEVYDFNVILRVRTSHNFILYCCTVCQHMTLKRTKKKKETNKEKTKNKAELKGKTGSKEEALYQVKKNSITLGPYPALAMTRKQRVQAL